MTTIAPRAGYAPIILPATQGNRRYAGVVAGPGGTGKSTLCGSIAETLGKDHVLLIATSSRETESWKYQKLEVPRVLLEDKQWMPFADPPKLTATAFSEFLRLTEWLRTDDQYDAIIVDSGTELAEAAWHAALAPHGVGTPSEIDGRSRWLPYETLDILMDQAIKGLVSLTKVAKRPKHIWMTWHIQPLKEDTVESTGDGAKTAKKSADHAGQGVEYEGNILPMVRGKFRRKLIHQVDAFLFSDVQMTTRVEGMKKITDVSYKVQVRPDHDRHTKLPGPLPTMSYIDNNFQSLIEVIEGRTPAAGAEAVKKTSPLSTSK